jgi:hypothetical protein
MTDVDWTSLGFASPGAPDVVALATGLETDVPVVLLPVRVETRFDVVEVPDVTDTGKVLLDALTAFHGTLRRIADRNYVTTLQGTVNVKKKIKDDLEQPLYTTFEKDLGEAAGQLQAVLTAARQPLTTGGGALADALTALVAAANADLADAHTALGGLRSPFQRQLLTGVLDGFAAQVKPALDSVGGRTVPGLRLAVDLRLRPAAQVARSFGRAPDGRPLRPDLVAGPDVTATAPVPVVIGDGTPPHAVGATRAVALEHGRIADTAAAVETLKTGLAAGAPLDGLVAAAAAIDVLPAAWKAELLAAIDAVPGTERVRAVVAAVPSGRADLDATVPEHLRRIVFELATPTRLEHRLQVRVYPEPLAVDTHEPELTDAESVAASAYWTETLAAGPDPAGALGAWRALCVGRSTRRAAWLAHVTEPPATAPTPGALAADALRRQLDVLAKRLDELARIPPLRRGKPAAAVGKAIDALTAAVGAAPALPPAAKEALVARLSAVLAAVETLAHDDDDRIELDRIGLATEWAETLMAHRKAVTGLPDEVPPRPVLPTTAHRASTWTRAASSQVLPDRFAVVTVAGTRVTHVAQGSTVPADLALGLDPSAPGGGFALDVDGNLDVPDSIRWLVDFDAAVAAGMAVSVPITPAEALAGFDEVLVVGLVGGDAAGGADRLASMLDGHHYTADGLALLPVGTATNNTETQSAGHTSADDPDLAFPIERGASLVGVAGSDGAALATAFGIDPTRLAHVAGAQGRDADDSRTATAALYAATIGHAVEELAGGLISFDARERLRAFVTGAVSARGLLPAIRVADEPYGVLPVTALHRFRADASDTRDGGGDAARQVLFDRVLLGVLEQMHADWTRLRAPVKHAHGPAIGGPGYDAQQHFLAMLGLQATSVSASYRFAVNVADRGGVRHHPELSLSFGVPKPGTATDVTSAQFGPFALMERFCGPLALAFGLPDIVLRAPAAQGGGVADHWKATYERLTSARAYELRQLKGIKPVRGVVAGPSAGITTLLAADYPTLADKAREVTATGVPLADMLVRHALLAEARRAAVRILFREAMLTDDAYARAVASSTYEWTTINGSFPVSSWGFLLSDVSDLDDRYGISYPAGGFAAYVGGSTMAEYLAGRGTSAMFTGYAAHADHQPAIDGLTAHAGAVAAFGALPAARVEDLVREHLDLGGHRLDAWLTGLAQRRLDAMRAPGATGATGARVGAFGWVENLRPDTTVRTAAVLPAPLAGRPGRPVVTDTADIQGFVQTPSPAHAVTAAILRSGYVSQANEGTLGNQMSINLGSGRVRTALALIDGVRAGNDLGALLGYRLERFLHEYYARTDTPHVTELDQLIAPLRRAFPTVAAVDPTADAGPERERQIVDGLAVIRTVLDWVATQPALAAATGTLYATLAAGGYAGYPWGLPPSAVPDAAQIDRVDGFLRALDDVASGVDALADLTTAEAVYQIVRGNHPRAAAVLQAMAEGKAPPPAEVAQTPRSGLAVTHRLLLQLDPTMAGWDAVAPTPRAVLEPVVDAWLGSLLGDPAALRVRVRPRPAAPPAAGTPAAVGTPVAEVSMVDLGLRPLDLLAMLGPGYDGGVPDLVARVLDARRPINVEPDQPGLPTPDPKDDFVIDPGRAPGWGPGIRSIGDVSALLESAGDLLGRVRPATAADYAAQGTAPAVGGNSADADAAARITTLRAAARDVALTLARLLAADDTLDAGVLDGDPRAFVLAHDDVHLHDDPDVGRVLVAPDLFWGARETWRAAVVAAARFGLQCAPPRRYGSRAQVAKELLQAAEAGFVELTNRIQAGADADVATTPAASRLTDVASALLGDAAVVVPGVDLDDVRAELTTSLAAKLAAPAELDGWLEGAAAVRDSARHLSEVLLLGGDDLPAQVAQLPATAGEPWLGGALADPDTMSGRVSVVIYGAAALPAAGATGVGLVVDEWTEVVPYREQTTGVAVHYDQPDSTAPQGILVAVPPERGRPWEFADLVATLHDTLEMARNRAVEPEHLGADVYGQVLPLMVGEIVPEAARGSAPAGGRVILDFAQNNPGGH